MTSPVYAQTPGPLGELFASFGVSHSVKIPLPGFSFVTTSGQPGFDQHTGKLVTSSVRDEIKACFDCVHSALQASGVRKGLAQAHKISVFLIDVRYDPTVLEVWRERYINHHPTMVTIGVNSLGLPGMHVEMTADAIIVDDDRSVNGTTSWTPNGAST